MTRFYLAVAASLLLLAGRADGAIRITEWMYAGDDGEFIEFTNMGAVAVDLTGWSFSDNNRTPGDVSLTPLGTIAPGESFLISENDADTFRTAWGLAGTVKILGENSRNLGRNDEINIYDASNTLVDRLTYGDQDIPGSIRTQNASGIPMTIAALGANDVLQWQFAAAGDTFGSVTGAAGNVASPGVFTLVPEPATFGVGLLGALGIAALVRRR